MRKNAQKVIEAFEAGVPCNGKTIWTDGATVWSYSMKIAEHSNMGVKIIAYEKAPTATTRSHVRALQQTFRNAKVL